MMPIFPLIINYEDEIERRIHEWLDKKGIDIKDPRDKEFDYY